jgi:integrase
MKPTSNKKSRKVFDAYARDHEGKLRHRQFATEQQAAHWKEEMAQERKAIKEGRALPKKENVILADFSRLWLQAKMKETTTSTVQGYANQLRIHVLPFIGEKKMSELHQLQLESLLDTVQADHGLSNAMRNRIRAMLSSMWNDARKLRVVASNPFELIEQKKENPAAAVTIWTLEEARKYLEAARELGWEEYVFAQVNLNTGTRKGETIAIQVKHVHLVERAIRIEQIFDPSVRQIVARTKSDGQRKVLKIKYVGINDTLYKVLKEHFKRNPALGPDDFIVTFQGRQMMPEAANRMNNRIIAHAGIRHARVHDNRHLAGSLMKQALGDIHAVKENLGHSTVTTTERYVHAGLEDAARRGARFNPFDHVSRVSETCRRGGKTRKTEKVAGKRLTPKFS